MEKFHPWLRSYWHLLTARSRELVIFNDVTPERLTLYLGNLTHPGAGPQKLDSVGERRKKNKKEIKEPISKLGVKA